MAITYGGNNGSILIGDEAGGNLVRSNRNTIVGTQAFSPTTREGDDNTAVVANSLKRHQGRHRDERDRNSTLGSGTLEALVTGSNNIAIGYKAGSNVETGSGNIYIGAYAGQEKHRRKQQALSLTAKEQTLVSGDFVKRDITFHATLNADLLTQDSDARLKKDIDPINLGLEAILQLEGKTYKWNDASRSQQTHIGLIAQEVEKVIPEVVTEDENGFKAIAYAKLTTILIEAIKEQQEIFSKNAAELSKNVADLEGAIAVLESENAHLKALVSNDLEALLARVAALEGISLANIETDAGDRAVCVVVINIEDLNV